MKRPHPGFASSMALIAASALAAAWAQPSNPGAETQATQATPGQEEAKSSPSLTPKNPLLLMAIIQPILNALRKSGSDSVGPVFSRVVNDAGASHGAANEKKADEGKEPPDGHGTLTAAIAYSVDQVDPTSFKVLKALDMTQASPQLRTGDAFAIRISTNLPGQVRVDNIDSTGLVSPQGVYNVLPGRDNRIPRTKAIVLVGDPGLETFKAYFTACIPPEVKSLPEMAYFDGKLSACGDKTPATLALASKGVLHSKSARNLDMPDTAVAVSALPDMKPGDVVSHEFALDHIAP